MSAKVVFNDDQLKELQELMNSGVKQTDIAKHFKVTDDTIRRICREHDFQVRMPHKCTCILCGDVFYSNVKGAKTCKKEHHRKCVVCGEDFIVNRDDIRDTCSPKCSSIYKFGTEHPLQSKKVRDKINATIAERYGVTNVSQLDDHRAKSEQTCLSRYGATSYAGSEVGRAATRQTNLERYGYAEPFGDANYREKLAQINLDRYGTVHPMQTDEILEKQQLTMQQRYGVTNCMQLADVREKQQSSTLAHLGVRFPFQSDKVKQAAINASMQKYGVPWPCMSPEINKLIPRSKINQAFESMLEANNLEFSYEYPLDNYVFDIKCGDTLIEIDPTYTHNAYQGIRHNPPKSSTYHLNKTRCAELRGYRCIHVFDWDNWDDILRLLVRPHNVLYGRDNHIRVELIDEDASVAFVSQNHIQGSCNGQKLNYGLFYNDELIQVMTFGKPRYSAKFDIELLRLCTKQDWKVVGGASKLFHQFIHDNPDKSVISYCDASKFTGQVYLHLGMYLHHLSDPAKVWSKDRKHITDNLLRQRGYDQLFGTNYGKGTSNEQLMIENGWLPVYDCGQKVFVYELNA